MSAGAFTISFYQANNLTSIYGVRVQPETLDLVIDGTSNTAGGAASNQQIQATVAGKRRRNGVNCRKVRFRFKTTAPAGYKLGQIITLPILTPTFYEVIEKFQEGTYLGQVITVVGKTPEYIN